MDNLVGIGNIDGIGALEQQNNGLQAGVSDMVLKQIVEIQKQIAKEQAVEIEKQITSKYSPYLIGGVAACAGALLFSGLTYMAVRR